MGLYVNIRDYVKSKFSKVKSIQDINYRRPNLKMDNRKFFKILFIDDKEISVISDLRNDHGYDITYKNTQLDTYNDAAAYDIILCDLNDVAPNLTHHGASLIKELRTAYPDKFLILYTAGTLTIQQDDLATKYADGRIRKGQDIDTWISILDKCILDLADPKFAWDKIKKYLESKDVRTKEIAKMEDIFVRKYEKDKIPDFQKVIGQYVFNESAEEIRAFVTPIITKLVRAGIQ